MTSHELARQLLNGPDLPIVVPKVKEYSEDEEDCCAEPNVRPCEGRDESDLPSEMLVISYLRT